MSAAKDQGITQVDVNDVVVVVILFYLSHFLFKRNLSGNNYSKPEFEPGTFSTLVKLSTN